MKEGLKNNSKTTGDLGEKLAIQHLLKKGYQIIEKNWRFKKYEIDVIAKNEETMVFLEVKTRKNDIFGEPQIFVSKQKQGFLIKAAQQYLEQNNISLESRFDIIAIVKSNNQYLINHLEGAFYPLVK